MKLFRIIIVFLLMAMTGNTVQAQSRQRISTLVQENSEVPAPLAMAASNCSNRPEMISGYAKRFFLQAFTVPKTIYNKRAFNCVEERLKNNLLKKLICSNLQLSFRLSKTMKLKLSYI
ncbi:MAG TPA: hypothetical protein PL029_09910 [Bacteroidia bacterium]|nr:hypothetical protein [Bacteroidia bacterium]